MKKAMWVALATLVGAYAAFALMAPAGATPAPGTPTFETCANLKGWYVNPDETSRRPTPTADGLKFEKNQLVHHGATGSIEGLKPGSYTLAAGSASPDQPSFFSVEVRNADGSGYATLRWNSTTDKWNMVASGQLFEHANPAELVKMTTPHKSSFLLSFGVGYTNSPPGTKTAVVKSVTFKGTNYPLTCPPAPSQSGSASASASKSASPSASASASASASSSAPVTAPASLPVTGSKVPLILGTGALLVAVGAGGVFLSRRKRVRFE